MGNRRERRQLDHLRALMPVKNLACHMRGADKHVCVAIITHDFPPHSWQTIRKPALRSLHANNHWELCKASAKLLMDLQAEFEDGALFCSILEV